jgi:hypothetical protein
VPTAELALYSALDADGRLMSDPPDELPSAMSYHPVADIGSIVIDSESLRCTAIQENFECEPSVPAF